MFDIDRRDCQRRVTQERSMIVIDGVVPLLLLIDCKTGPRYLFLLTSGTATWNG